MSIIDRIIYRLTARRWNHLISRVLCAHYECNRLTSAQLHRLAAEFDPTQKRLAMQVGRLLCKRPAAYPTDYPMIQSESARLEKEHGE